MSEPRDYHTVPHFYLAGFTPSERKKDRLWETEFEKRTQKQKLPAEASVVRDFYRVEVDGLDPNEVERLLKTVEDEASRIIKTTNGTRKLPAGEDLGLLIDFMALMAVRIPGYAEILKGMWTWAHESLTEYRLTSEDSWRNAVFAAKAGGADLPIEVDETSIKESYAALKKMYEEKTYSLEWRTGWHLDHMMSSWKQIANLLEQRKWLLVVSDKKIGEFICTDRPVALMFTDDEVPARMSPGFGLPNTRVFFPLNRRMVLIGQYDFAYNGTERATPELVAVANSVQLNYQRKFVYSSRKDFVLLDHTGKPYHFTA